VARDEPERQSIGGEGMYVRRVTINATTDGSGDATVYSGRVTGKVLGVAYVKDDFADGVDFTITTEASGETVWAQENVNASAVKYPRRLVQDTVGVDIAATYDSIYMGNDRLKIVIASGGATKSGTFYLLMG
jgi:hypothetical protein